MNKKKIYWFLLFFLASFGIMSQALIAQESHKEYLVLRVYYKSRNSMIISNLSVEMGQNFSNSLANKIQNGESGAVKISSEDGKILVIHNEVDFLNFLASIGWELHSSYPVKIHDRTYVQFILVKGE